MAAALRAQPVATDTASSAPIELLAAGELEMMRLQGIESRFLRSTDSIRVAFRQGDLYFECDQAIHFPDSNFVVAFGEIYIERGDSIRVEGDTLLYYGNSRFAELRSNVVFTDQHITLESPYVNYFLNDDLATYQYGATITDREATLTSRRGYYYTRQKLLAFQGQVRLDNPKAEYQVATDTLTYHTVRKAAYFHAPADIQTPNGRIAANRGEYYPQEGRSYFTNRVTIENEEYIWEADTLRYAEIARTGAGRGRVRLYHKQDSLSLFGDQAYFEGEADAFEVYGHALLQKPFGADTLFLAADTLRSATIIRPAAPIAADSPPATPADSLQIADSTAALPADSAFAMPADSALALPPDTVQVLLAYPRVKIYTRSVEGVCDSMAYHTADSLIEFFRNPILWAGDSQLTADTLVAILDAGNIRQLLLRKNAFIVSEDSIRQFDQVKGRNMVAQFEQGYIRQVDVNGNGQSIYFALEGDSLLVGMNRVDCGNMVMRFEGQNELQHITFIKKPEAKFIPPHELTRADLRLPDFAWHSALKPGRRFVQEHPFWVPSILPPKAATPPKPAAKADSLEARYGTRIAQQGFSVHWKPGMLTFVLTNPHPSRLQADFYVDIIPKRNDDLPEAWRERHYEQRTAQPGPDDLAKKPFVLQIPLPSYPAYTLRFGQFTLNRDESQRYVWSEAYNLP
jgi:hypothetical protein